MKNALVNVVTILAALCVGSAAQNPTKQNHPQPNPVPGRSVVTSRYGVVAATQPMAAISGVQILERGGNAVDAAIATNAVLGLMEPVNNGIGGDLFAIIYEGKTGKLYGLNASGWASTAETPEMFRAKGITKMPESGVWTVTVPGAVAGWAALQQKFGTKPLSELLAPAIYYAENGVPINEVTAEHWAGF